MSETEEYLEYLEMLNDKAYLRIVEIVTGYDYNDNTSKLGAISAVLENRETAESFI